MIYTSLWIQDHVDKGCEETSNFSYLDYSLDSVCDFFPLNGFYHNATYVSSQDSSSSKKNPIEKQSFDENNIEREASAFVYDNELHRYVYESRFDCADHNVSTSRSKKSVLAYCLSLSSTNGFISIRFKLNPTNSQENRCILSNLYFQSNSLVIRNIFSIYVNANNRLVLSVKDEPTITKDLEIESNWNQLFVKWDQQTIYLKVNNSDFIPYYSNNNLSQVLLDLASSSSRTYLGSTYLMINSQKTLANPLQGQLESLCYGTIYTESNNSFVEEVLSLVPLTMATTYDICHRIIKNQPDTTNSLLDSCYTYDDTETSYGKRVTSLKQGQEISYYGYNELGLVTHEIVMDLNQIVKRENYYEYDKLSRLSKEEHYGQNHLLDFKVDYTYSDSGNILTKHFVSSNQDIQYQYSYSSLIPNQLLQVKQIENGIETIQEECTYQNLNLTSISAMNQTIAITQEGKRITSIGTHLYRYNEKGQRIQKDHTIYHYRGDNLIESCNLTTGNLLHYLYNERNELTGFTYQDKYFTYKKDLTQNILGILDKEQHLVVQYKYDAFGKVLEKTIEETELAQTLAEENIFLYKGYCYDNETGLYWLTSRYYNPEWGRFISPDSIDYLDPSSINGLNLYAYCGNDPANNYDPTGHFTITALLISIGISLAFEVIQDALDGNGMDHDFMDYLGAGISGAFGGLGGVKIAQVIFSVSGGLVDAVLSGDLEEQGLGKTLFNIGISTCLSALAGSIGSKITSKIKGNSLSKLSRHAIKNEISNMGLKYSITKNGTSAKAIAKYLGKEGNNWIGKIAADYGTSSIVSGVLNLFNF